MPHAECRSRPLSREVIAVAALGLLDSHGVTALTMRGLANSLGVKAPSLYNHVHGLEDVVDLVQELVNLEIDQSGFGDDDLRAGLEAVARSYRAAYLRHPNVLAHVVRRVMKAPTAVALYGNFADCFVRQGVPRDDVLMCTAMIDGVVLGSTLDTFHAGFTAPADYADEHPALAQALAASDRGQLDDEAFQVALDAVITQIERRISDPKA